MDKESITLKIKMSIKDKLADLKKGISSQRELNIIDNVMEDIEKI
jgi:hypothetical protein